MAIGAPDGANKYAFGDCGDLCKYLEIGESCGFPDLIDQNSSVEFPHSQLARPRNCKLHCGDVEQKAITQN